jgi:putative Holliday junction resolvase
MRVLALDVGERRIGVAVSDPTQTLARSLTVLQRVSDERVVQCLAALIREQGVERIVMGYPLGLDGDVGPQAKRTGRLAQTLAAKLGVEVQLWDESYSTVEAERILGERRIRGARRRQKVDATAAAVILQNYLDTQARCTGPTRQAV